MCKEVIFFTVAPSISKAQHVPFHRPSSDKISQLKQLLQDSCKYPAAMQVLRLRGTVLKDEATLAECGVSTGDIITMILRPHAPAAASKTTMPSHEEVEAPIARAPNKPAGPLAAFLASTLAAAPHAELLHWLARMGVQDDSEWRGALCSLMQDDAAWSSAPVTPIHSARLRNRLFPAAEQELHLSAPEGSLAQALVSIGVAQEDIAATVAALTTLGFPDPELLDVDWHRAICVAPGLAEWEKSDMPAAARSVITAAALPPESAACFVCNLLGVEEGFIALAQLGIEDDCVTWKQDVQLRRRANLAEWDEFANNETLRTTFERELLPPQGSLRNFIEQSCGSLPQDVRQALEDVFAGAGNWYDEMLEQITKDELVVNIEPEALDLALLRHTNVRPYAVCLILIILIVGDLLR